MKLFLSSLLLISFVTINSCKEDVEEPVPVNDLTENVINLADSIVGYTGDTTNYRAQSVFYFTNFDPQCQAEAHPMDSTAKVEIDIDLDSISDFIIQMNHYSFTSGGSHCTLFNYYITIYGKDSLSQISCQMNNYNQYYVFDYVADSLVSDSGSWRNSAKIKDVTTGYPYKIYFYNEKLIGLRKNSNYGWALISPYNANGIWVKRHAFNFTPGNFIRAGQMQ